jgi:sulfite reductase alpha subunit-like flavoprotein
MAKDVDKALHDIIAIHGNKSAEQAIQEKLQPRGAEQ